MNHDAAIEPAAAPSSRSLGSLSTKERVLAALILFYSAVVFCLPVPPSEDIAALYPWWGNRIGIGNVLLHEVLFLSWLLLFGARFVSSALLKGHVPTRQAAVWLMALALWCGLMSLLAPLPALDIGRTFRLLLNATLLFAIVRWAARMGESPLAMMILGFLAGTIINLVLSFRFPLIVLDTMRLSGQNTPGVAMGVAIHLAAWLFFRTRRRSLQVMAAVASAVFAFGCAISYSRIGWFAGGLGLMAWAYVLLLARPRASFDRRHLRSIRVVLVPVLVLGVSGLLMSPLGQLGLQWMQTLAEQKFSGPSEGDTQRWAYVTGTAEIISRHPFGVGYSGFFEAMTATDTYRSGMAAEEESVVDANPHASFLWYTTSGGMPGGVMAILVFGLLLNSMRVGLRSAFGRPGLVLFIMAAMPFVVIGLTVPYLFNSNILIAPAAIAAGWGWAQQSVRAAQPEASATRTTKVGTDLLPSVR